MQTNAKQITEQLMALNLFDLFKLGIGPFPHTVGPMMAAYQFTNLIEALSLTPQLERLRIDIYGSLGATGKGQ